LLLVSLTAVVLPSCYGLFSNSPSGLFASAPLLSANSTAVRMISRLKTGVHGSTVASPSSPASSSTAIGPKLATWAQSPQVKGAAKTLAISAATLIVPELMLSAPVIRAASVAVSAASKVGLGLRGPAMAISKPVVAWVALAWSKLPPTWRMHTAVSAAKLGGVAAAAGKRVASAAAALGGEAFIAVLQLRRMAQMASMRVVTAAEKLTAEAFLVLWQLGRAASIVADKVAAETFLVGWQLGRAATIAADKVAGEAFLVAWQLGRAATIVALDASSFAVVALSSIRHALQNWIRLLLQHAIAAVGRITTIAVPATAKAATVAESALPHAGARGGVAKLVQVFRRRGRLVARRPI